LCLKREISKAPVEDRNNGRLALLGCASAVSLGVRFAWRMKRFLRETVCLMTGALANDPC